MWPTPARTLPIVLLAVAGLAVPSVAAAADDAPHGAVVGPAVPAAEPDVPPRGTVRGVVTSDAGVPLAGAGVEVRRGGAVVASTRTGDDGSWAIEGLAADGEPYVVEATAADHLPQLVGEGMQHLPGPNVEVSADRTTVVSHSLPRLTATIRGRVLGGGGAPLAGVTVSTTRISAFSLGGVASRVLEATTAEDGGYLLRVPAGYYQLYAGRPDLVTRWTDGAAPHESATPQAASTHELTAGQELPGLDFRLLPRPARSCWGPGPTMNERRTLVWLTGATERPDPSWPPADADLCAAPHAAQQIRMQNEGSWSHAGVQMDLWESFLAGGQDGPPIAMDRRAPAQTELDAWIAENAPLIASLLASGRPASALPTTPPPGHPLAAVPAPRPIGALPPTVALPGAVVVPRDRFSIRTRCAATGPCDAGTLTASPLRGVRTPVATGRHARTTAPRAVALRMSSYGRRLLRSSGSVRVRIAWTARGGDRRIELGTVRLRSTTRR